MNVWDSWNHISTLLLDIYACILLLGLATQRQAMSRFDKLSSPSFSTLRGLSAHLPATLNDLITLGQKFSTENAELMTTQRCTAVQL